MLKLLRLTFCLLVMASSANISVRAADTNDAELAWHDDYVAAYRQAKDQQKMLLIHFAAEQPTAYRRAFDATLADDAVQRLCHDFVLLRVPRSYEAQLGDEAVPLLKHHSFASMQGKAGLAIVDLKHSDRDHYTHLVSALPFESPVYYAPNYAGVKSVRTLLGLPAGTLTQRTMIYAVRLHPELPASTRGRAEPFLLSQCAGHCSHQARTGVQGHQGFDARFHRINARLGGMAASEVVAESWPGEDLVAACFSCVHSWRGSPGHWSAVSAAQPSYGYDIRRGGNKWYATGLFAGR